MSADAPTHRAARRTKVIQSKLAVPALPSHYAVRPRVERPIADAIDRQRAVVLAATAGAGKTTAVVGACRQLPFPTAWLTVDRSDRAPGRLLVYLEAAIGQAVPAAGGVVGEALAAGLPHSEAAGLLAEALQGHRIVVVLDELERLVEEPEPWSVIEAFLRYAPPGTCTVLLSRREIPTRLCALPSPEAFTVIRDVDVAFTTDEATEALRVAGLPPADVDGIVRRTAGWATGVLFEGSRDSSSPAGGTDTDPLFEYISVQVLDQLAPEDREFLVLTSLLDEVDMERAEALGRPDAAERLASLRTVHLPAAWDGDRQVLRCHSFLREHLQRELLRRPGPVVREAHRRLGVHLAGEGLHEDAVEQLLEARDLEGAARSARKVVLGVLERADFDVAGRWLGALADLPPTAETITAALMLAIGRDDLSAAAAIVDRLNWEERQALAASSEDALWLMTWTCMHQARAAEVRQLLAIAPAGTGRDAVRWAARVLMDEEHPRDDPPATGIPLLDAMVLSANYPLGRLTSWLAPPRETPWAASVEVPYRIAALRALGRTEEALELYEAARSSGRSLTVQVFAGPDLLLDLGRVEEARQLLEESRGALAARGSTSLTGLHRLTEARLLTRHLEAPERALALLEAPGFRASIEGMRFLVEAADSWAGFALLLLGRDAEAHGKLLHAVDTMVRGDRLLELPAAAVYLAEASWRLGDEEGADRAADIALAAAESQGSRHLLLQALADFPAVAARRRDAEHSAESSWHDLGRALVAQGGQGGPAVGSRVELLEFGRRAVLVDGEEARTRIAKTYELLAFLVTADRQRTTRDELLDVLFEGRRDPAARSYLRQAIRFLRQVLPEGTVEAEEGSIRLTAPVVTESQRLERQLAAAAAQQGDARLSATLRALEAYDRGTYLPGAHGEWADERAQQLDRLAADARHEAAVVAYGAGRLHQARALVDRVTRDDPLREAAWRLAMRITDSLGDHDGVLHAYRRCEAALTSFGATPSATTRDLLASLRSRRTTTE